MKSVVLTGKELNGEASHATLTCVEGVPNVVHHGVDCVIKACLFVQNKDGLDCTIPGIPIKTFKLEQANVSRLANICLLIWSMDTVGVGAANGLIIRDQSKIFRRRRWSDSIILCIRESNDPVAWCCAREVAAVLHIGPFLGRLGQENCRISGLGHEHVEVLGPWTRKLLGWGDLDKQIDGF